PVDILPVSVDDSRGVLAVRLAGPEKAVKLVATEAGGPPPAVVEEYRGVSAVLKGDFLGNGREQLVLLPSPAESGDGTASAVAGAISAAGGGSCSGGGS
ncbi:unnamed protein product, partial [Phaeothamnion confervicola]